MARSGRRFVVRISLALAGGMLFLAGTMLFVKRYLPNDQLLVHRLHFTVDENAPITQEQWRRFGRRQKDYLLDQTRQIMPQLAEFVNVTFDDYQPIITLKLRCPGAHAGSLINENIDKLLDVYAAHRDEIEPVMFAGDDPPFALLKPENIEKLKQYTESHAQLQQQLTDLQNRYRRLSVATLELIQSIDRGVNQTVTGPIAVFIGPQLEQAYHDDIQIKPLLSLLSELQEKIDDLDLNAAHADSKQVIDSLARQRESLNEQCLLLQRQINQRRTQLTEDIKQRQWPLYEVETKNKITNNQQLMQQYAADLITLEKRIKQILDMIITIDSTRAPDYAAADRKSVAEAALDARLRLSNLHDHRDWKYPFSRLQIILMIVAALIGLLVGFFIPIGGAAPAEREGDTQAAYSPRPSETIEPPAFSKPQLHRLKSKSPMGYDRTGGDILPPLPVQLYIDQHDLRPGQISEKQPFAWVEQTPMYLQFYVDEKDLIAEQALAYRTGREHLYMQFYINEQVLAALPPAAVSPSLKAETPAVQAPPKVILPATVPEPPSVPEPPTAPETPTVTEPPAVASPPSQAEGPADRTSPTVPEPKSIVESPSNIASSKKMEPPIMSEEIPDAAESTEQTQPAEKKQQMLLASIDLERDHATALESDSPYARLCEPLNQLRADNPCPVVVISALEPAAISPRFAVNLALSLATKKLRVLLIEAELSNGDLAAIFESADKPGFFEWRRGAIWASRVTTETMLEGLIFMPAGEPCAEQSDNLSDLSKEAHRWSNLRRSYDTILLYGPGSLTAAPKTPHQPAGSQLLDLADAVISITRPAPDAESKKTQAFVSTHLGVPEQIERLKKLLKSRRAQLLGLIALL